MEKTIIPKVTERERWCDIAERKFHDVHLHVIPFLQSSQSLLLFQAVLHDDIHLSVKTLVVLKEGCQHHAAVRCIVVVCGTEDINNPIGTFFFHLSFSFERNYSNSHIINPLSWLIGFVWQPMSYSIIYCNWLRLFSKNILYNFYTLPSFLL